MPAASRSFNPLVAGSNPARPTKIQNEKANLHGLAFLFSGRSLVASEESRNLHYYQSSWNFAMQRISGRLAPPLPDYANHRCNAYGKTRMAPAYSVAFIFQFLIRMSDWADLFTHAIAALTGNRPQTTPQNLCPKPSSRSVTPYLIYHRFSAEVAPCSTDSNSASLS
jgi:hypothetical protein